MLLCLEIKHADNCVKGTGAEKILKPVALYTSCFILIIKLLVMVYFKQNSSMGEIGPNHIQYMLCFHSILSSTFWLTLCSPQQIITDCIKSTFQRTFVSSKINMSALWKKIPWWGKSSTARSHSKIYLV